MTSVVIDKKTIQLKMDNFGQKLALKVLDFRRIPSSIKSQFIKSIYGEMIDRDNLRKFQLNISKKN